MPVSISILALAGCGVTGSRSEPKVVSQRESGTPGTSVPSQGPKPIDRPSGIVRESRSPLQVAALHRLERAKTLIAEGEFLPAISDLEKTLAMDSTNPHTYLYLARAHHGLGHFRESLDFLEVEESLFGDERVSLAEV